MAERRSDPGDTIARPRPSEPATGAAASGDADLGAYLDWARQRYQGVSLRGVGGGEVWLRLEEVYVPLRMGQRPVDLELDGRMGKRRGELYREAAHRELELEEIFQHAEAHAAIFGEPGAGKTTALRKLHQRCFEPGGENASRRGARHEQPRRRGSRIDCLRERWSLDRAAGEIRGAKESLFRGFGESRKAPSRLDEVSRVAGDGSSRLEQASRVAGDGSSRPKRVRGSIAGGWLEARAGGLKVARGLVERRPRLPSLLLEPARGSRRSPEWLGTVALGSSRFPEWLGTVARGSIWAAGNPRGLSRAFLQVPGIFRWARGGTSREALLEWLYAESRDRRAPCSAPAFAGMAAPGAG